jgi:hypothetical protein
MGEIEKLVMKYEITLEGREELIDLRNLNIKKLEEMIQISIEFENYEMCGFIQKININKSE